MSLIDVRAAQAMPGGVTLSDRPMTTEDVEAVDAATARYFEQVGFDGSVGQVVTERGPGEGTVEIIVGIGPAGDVNADALCKAAAAVVRAAKHHEAIATTLVEHRHELSVGRATDAVVRGLSLASYRFDRYKDRDESDRLRRATVVDAEGGASEHLAVALARVNAVAFTRDLVNEPGGSLTPTRFVELVSERALAAGLEVEVWDNETLRAERMGGMLAVNQGSEHEARLLILRYEPEDTNEAPEVALVGKGVTFDSGGLSLKSPTNMMQMKVDMGGAATVAAAMCALPDVGCDVSVIGYLALTDNMTGPDAQRPGDVFTARNGTTVEVLNTDAEGRLILADALSVAAEAEPGAIIDLATLTGSASAALGLDYAALLSNNDDLADWVGAAAEVEGERVWPLPLHDGYRSQLDSQIADLRNIGTGPYGGAIVAALFLEEFVDDVPWAHLDLGLSVMSEKEDGPVVKGATGNLTLSLITLLTHWKTWSEAS